MKSERFLFPYCRYNSPEILLLFKDSPPPTENLMKVRRNAHRCLTLQRFRGFRISWKVIHGCKAEKALLKRQRQGLPTSGAVSRTQGNSGEFKISATPSPHPIFRKRGP